MQIGFVDEVAVNETDGPNARSGKIRGSRTTQPAHTHNQDGGALEFQLTYRRSISEHVEQEMRTCPMQYLKVLLQA